VDETQGGNPDSLDPGYAFFGFDGTWINNVQQDLVGYNGSDAFHYLPVEASGWTVANNSQEFVFKIRPDVYFSNGRNVTAYTIWFSYVREIYTNPSSGVASSNWNLITANYNDWFSATCLNAEPWGLVNAIQSAAGIVAGKNCKADSNYLNNMLSHFDPTNPQQQAVMAFGHQAYVAPNATTFIIRTLSPYSLLLSDIAGFSGSHTVDPVFVDANGGVQNNTADAYYQTHPGPGTGPYVIKSVGSGLSEVIMVKSPHYWASTSTGQLKPGLPWTLAPAQIPVIDVKYAPPVNVVYHDFGTNVAQLSGAAVAGSIGIGQWSQMYSAYNYKQYFTTSQLLYDAGPGDFANYLGMNTQAFPTNITAFRQAVYNSMNYTAFQQTQLYFNGKTYGSPMLGPAQPSMGSLYNPGNLPLPAQNIPLAIKDLQKAGMQGHFYVVLPNGTAIGDTSGNILPPVKLIYVAPLTPFQETQIEIYQASLASIGISFASQGVTSAVYSALIESANTTPPLVNIAWGLDYPDPWLQQMVCFYETTCHLPTWINNATLTNLINSASFNPSPAAQLAALKQLYIDSNAGDYYVWQPYQDNVMWVQPYVQGIYWNPYTFYYYNLIYYKPVSAG
jgi:ABC-type transport system substrate-binding protein